MLNQKRKFMKSRPDWYYNQSAVIPYKEMNGEIRVLLITSRKKKKWIVPKGIVELDLTPAESAEMEALEEAGVKGKVDNNVIGEYRQEKWGGVCNVEVYPMKVKEELLSWPEDNMRNRIWLPISEAVESVANKELSRIISRLRDYLKK